MEVDIEDFQGSVSVGSEISSKRSRGWGQGSRRVGFKGKGLAGEELVLWEKELNPARSLAV